MRSSCHSLDRLDVVFDDDNAVANGGLCLPMTLAEHLGLRELVDTHVDLGDAAGRANPGLKAMGLIGSALAGGDSIDDADVLRSGRSEVAIGQWMPAPSTLGTYLRGFTFGHARQLDKVAGEVLTRAWAAGAGPGDAEVVIDLDSTIVEVYGTKKQGARFGYTKKRGYHPLVATVAGTGDVVGVRARGGNAHSGRGAAGFLTEVFNRVRAAGAAGPMVLRADSGFYAKAVVKACEQAEVAFSITIKSCKSRGSSTRRFPTRTGRPSPTGWRAGRTSPRWPTGPSGPRRARRRASSCAGPSPRLDPSWRCSASTPTTPS